MQVNENKSLQRFPDKHKLHYETPSNMIKLQNIDIYDPIYIINRPTSILYHLQRTHVF